MKVGCERAVARRRLQADGLKIKHCRQPTCVFASDDGGHAVGDDQTRSPIDCGRPSLARKL